MELAVNSTRLEAIDRFVDAHDQAAAAHRTAWIDILRTGLGQHPLTLSAWRDGQTVGYLPLVLTRSVLFGRRLVSLPYVNEAGILADEPATAARLVERAIELGREQRARYVELRNRAPFDGPALQPTRTDKLRMTAALPDHPDALWKQIHSKARNQVRKAEKFDLTLHFGGTELLDAFYRVFAHNMRDLGTPVFPRKLFAAMLHYLGNDAELCLVEKDDRPIAAALLTHFRNTTEVPSASALRQYNSTCCNMLMYWHLLKRAVEREATVFDFGRSSEGSGTYKFKTQWSAAGAPTGWQLAPLRGQAKPPTKEDDQFALAIRIWQKLPVWFTRLAGPPIVRGIP